MLTLYKNHKNGVGTWKIWNEGCVIHIAHASVLDGAEVHHIELVDGGKQSRTLDEQVNHRIQSRINKQKDKGYVESYEEALTAPTNALNLLQPMLAQPLKRIGRLPDFINLQLKYDGHRCLITKYGGELIAYSRQGKYITTIQHILKDIDIDEGTTLDGELYAHGVPLQTVSSWIKRSQEDSLKLKYHVYDIIEDEPYSKRLQTLKELNLRNASVLVPTHYLEVSKINLTSLLQEVKHKNYEGLIVRTDTHGYEAGRRSASLIKVKSFLDGEYEIVDVLQSRDNWGILVLRTEDGKTFKASAPGDIPQKRKALHNKDNLLGKMVNVEYSLLTKDGIPFQPVCTRYIDDVSIS